MKAEPETMKAASLDMEAVRRGWAFMNSLQETGSEGRKSRLLFLRALAELARENAAARSITEWLLDVVGGKLPEETATFRAYYLEGERRPGARQLAKERFVDVATIYRHNRVILSAMLAPAFGVNGYFRMDGERETAPGAPGDRQETPPWTREG